MSINLLTARVCKSPATVGGADGTFHCLITEACIFSCSVTFKPPITQQLSTMSGHSWKCSKSANLGYAA